MENKLINLISKAHENNTLEEFKMLCNFTKEEYSEVSGYLFGGLILDEEIFDSGFKKATIYLNKK